MTKIPPLQLKGMFVCNRCRKSCKNGSDEVGVYGPDNCVEAYFPRKQKIACLGKYCEQPCELIQDSDLTFDALINAVKYLGDLVNHYIMKEQNK